MAREYITAIRLFLQLLNKFLIGLAVWNVISCSGSGIVIIYGSGSDFLTSYGSGSASQKVTVRCLRFRFHNTVFNKTAAQLIDKF